MRLTNEQKCILQYVKNYPGKHFKVKAYAGTGKTTMCKCLCRELMHEPGILYLAFNKSLKTEADRTWAKSFDNLHCYTFHGQAFRVMVKRGYDCKGADNKVIMRHLFEKGIVPGSDYSNVWGVINTIRAFCNDNCDEVKESHVLNVANIKADMTLEVDPFDARRAYWKEAAQKYWILLKDNGIKELTYDTMLRLYVEGEDLGIEKYSTIMVDEAQDVNPCMLKFIRKAMDSSRLILVGDSFQQIYGFTGADDSLSAFDSDCDNINMYLSQTFRGGHKIAEAGDAIINVLKKKGDVPFKSAGINDTRLIPFFYKGAEGEDCINSIVEEEDSMTVITRTNSQIIHFLETRLRHLEIDLDFKVSFNVQEVLEEADKIQNFIRGISKSYRGFRNVDEFMCMATQSRLTDLPCVWLPKIIIREYWDRIKELLLHAKESYETARVELTTVHKAKGREWDNVMLYGDYLACEGSRPSEEEIRIFYVALTRARQKLFYPEHISFQRSSEDYMDYIRSLNRGEKSNEAVIKSYMDFC